jgi:adenosylcobyric acid synthase
VQTRFDASKLLKDTTARFASDLSGAWAPLSGVETSGYEIHHGRTQARSDAARPVLMDAEGQCLGWQQGAGHGSVPARALFESEPVLHALLGGDVPSLPQVFEGLADYIDRHFEPGTLMSLLKASHA